MNLGGSEDLSYTRRAAALHPVGRTRGFANAAFMIEEN